MVSLQILKERLVAAQKQKEEAAAEADIVYYLMQSCLPHEIDAHAKAYYAALDAYTEALKLCAQLQSQITGE